MGRLNVNNTTQPEKLVSRSTIMKNKKGANSSFNTLEKLRKQHTSFTITVLDQNEIGKKGPCLPEGFFVTDNDLSVTDGNASSSSSSSSQNNTKPKLKNARCMFVGDEYVLRKTFAYFNDDGKEETYNVDEPFNDDEDLEDGEIPNRVDEVNESWNAAYGEVSDPGTPKRVSFGAAQDIVVDRVRWTPKALREARKGPWLKLAFARKQSCPDSWAVSE